MKDFNSEEFEMTEDPKVHDMGKMWDALYFILAGAYATALIPNDPPNEAVGFLPALIDGGLPPYRSPSVIMY